uniref:Uncharacterized protein n=1 Tax=Strigamia maritima TaxID=126957 RepID=T1IQ76_STRMM
MKCVLQNKEGIYKRKKRPSKFDPYDKEMRSAIDRYQQVFETALKLHSSGYPTQMIDFIDSMLPSLSGLAVPKQRNFGPCVKLSRSLVVAMWFPHAAKTQKHWNNHN